MLLAIYIGIVIIVKLFQQETAAPFEYCFISNIANPLNTNLTVRIVYWNMSNMLFIHFV